MRSSAAPGATEGMGRETGMPRISPRCRSKMAFPSSRRTSSGKERIASRAAGWKIAARTIRVSHIWDIKINKDVVGPGYRDWFREQVERAGGGNYQPSSTNACVATSKARASLPRRPFAASFARNSAAPPGPSEPPWLAEKIRKRPVRPRFPPPISPIFRPRFSNCRNLAGCHAGIPKPKMSCTPGHSLG
jgi:hypothetical protein